MALRITVFAVLVFLGLPLALITLLSFNSTSSFTFPPDGFSLRWYANVFSIRAFGTGLIFSVYLAVAAVAVGLVVATAASLAITRYRFWGRDIINAVIMAPLVVPE
ncbi:MAG: ABC transporter permease, partial [Bauldia litoralis]